MLSILRNPWNLAGLMSGVVHAGVLTILALWGSRTALVEFATHRGGVSLSVRMQAESDPASTPSWHVHVPGTPQEHHHPEHAADSWVVHAHTTPLERQPAVIPKSNLAATSDLPASERHIEPHQPLRQRVDEAQRDRPPPSQLVTPLPRRAVVLLEEHWKAAPISPNDAPGATVDSIPRNLPTNSAPPYPAESFRRGEEGLVILRVRINVQGRVAEIQVLQSSGFGLLDRSALDTVRTWRFSPARNGGVAVSATVEVPVRFNIRD
jgi:protein TonB